MTPLQLAQWSQSWMDTVGQLEQAEATRNLAASDAAYDEQRTLLRQLVCQLAEVDQKDVTQVTRLILAARVATRISKLKGLEDVA